MSLKDDLIKAGFKEGSKTPREEYQKALLVVFNKNDNIRLVVVCRWVGDRWLLSWDQKTELSVSHLNNADRFVWMESPDFLHKFSNRELQVIINVKSNEKEV